MVVYEPAEITWNLRIEFRFFFFAGDLMENLVPHPEFKMLGVRNIPQMSENSLAYSTFTWAGLLKHLRQMLISNAKMEEGKGYFKNMHPQTGKNACTEVPNINWLGPVEIIVPSSNLGSSYKNSPEYPGKIS